MNELRELRRDADLTQRDLAALLGVPVNTLRMWDSGLRPVPPHMLLRARAAVEHHARQKELLPLAQLAEEFHVHVRTLQAAARTGRLAVQFSVKSVFGRPRRLATRAAAEQFMATHYRRFSEQKICPAPLPTVPHDYHQQLRTLRRRLRPTQDGLADALAPPARRSSISGSHGREHRRRCSGRRSCGCKSSARRRWKRMRVAGRRRAEWGARRRRTAAEVARPRSASRYSTLRVL
jgi:transcriptional regulator with XRE-family HTH domain